MFVYTKWFTRKNIFFGNMGLFIFLNELMRRCLFITLSASLIILFFFQGKKAGIVVQGKMDIREKHGSLREKVTTEFRRISFHKFLDFTENLLVLFFLKPYAYFFGCPTSSAKN